MAITIKTPEEIETLREGGKRLAYILKDVSSMVAPGVSTQELEDRTRVLLAESGDTGAFLNYTPSGAKRPFPACLCVSVNDEVVHGIPNEDPKTLEEGDVVTVDMGLVHNGLITDSAVTVPVGKVNEEIKKLIKATREARDAGVRAAVCGGHVGDIGAAVEEAVEGQGFAHVQGLCGHGVGYSVHEDPYVPNQGKQGEGEELKPGMVIAIEPMLSLGTGDVVLDKDGYTFKTKDGSINAHFEHTVAITDNKPIILTEA